MDKKNVFLTGKPGVGKTTLIEKFVQSLPLLAGGFVTREIREGGRRVGFEIQALSGEKGIMAHVGFPYSLRVGRYGVDISCLERIGVVALERAVHSSPLVVVDEIGKMELMSVEFRKMLLKVLDSPKMVLATITKGKGGVVGMMKSRSDVVLIEVTVENRDRLVKEVGEWVLSRVKIQGKELV